MNTLSRQYTRKFFPLTEDYHLFRQHWSQLTNSSQKHNLTAVHHLAYLVLCGKDWRKAFTFPTNRNKLDNGFTPELYRALEQLGSKYQEAWVLAPFDGAVSHETLLEARKLVAHVLADLPAPGANSRCECAAYCSPEPCTKEGA